MDVWKNEQAIKKLEKSLDEFSKEIDKLHFVVKNIENFIQSIIPKKKKEKMDVDAMESIAKKKTKKKGKKDVL